MMKRIICLSLLTCLSILALPMSFANTELTDVPAAVMDELHPTTAADIGTYDIPHVPKGYTWMQGHIPTDLVGTPVVFQIPSPRIYNYHFYVLQDGKLKEIPRNTDSRSRYFKSRFPQYAWIPSDSTYYIAIGHHQPQTLQVEIQEHDQFLSSESFRLFRIGLYYGLALMSVVFNLVFYLVFKDKRFITYCLLLFTTFVSFFYEDGMFYYFSDGQWTMDYLTVWNSSFTAIVALLFTYYFLGLEAVLLPYRKWFYMAASLLLSGALGYTITQQNILLHIVVVTCFLFALTCLFLAVRRFKQDVYARFLTLAFSLVVFTGILYVLYSRLDPLKYTWFDINTFRLVSALEIISISFAIIFKVKALQQENERYREELNNYLKALEVDAANPCAPESGYPAGMPLVATKDELADELRINHDLTDRETDVLRCIWDGLTNKEISERLFITVSTTKYHIGNLYMKLDVKNRNQVQVLGKAQWVRTQ
ncbi:7TM diverse intracellular signaling domain-containing protein [Parapedobacter sp.]